MLKQCVTGNLVGDFLTITHLIANCMYNLDFECQRLSTADWPGYLLGPIFSIIEVGIGC